MRDDLRADVTELQREVHRLALENAELRAMLAGDAAASPGLGTGSALDLHDPEALDYRYGGALDYGYTGAIDARTGLSREMLRRRRFKGRLIAAALLLLGLGVGAAMIMAVGRQPDVRETPVSVEFPELPPVPPPPPPPMPAMPAMPAVPAIQ